MTIRTIIPDQLIKLPFAICFDVAIANFCAPSAGQLFAFFTANNVVGFVLTYFTNVHFHHLVPNVGTKANQ